MNRIPCEVVRDLLPSYIEDLTSDVSGRLIEEHVEKCSPCREVLQSMREEYGKDNTYKEAEEKEIDFLKKNRRRNRSILISCISAVILILAVLFITRYMAGQHFSDLCGDIFMWDVQVEGDRIILDGRVVDDIYKISGFHFGERDGRILAEADVVPSGFVAGLIYGKEFHAEYTAKQEFHSVEVNGRILWSRGQEISTHASSVYYTRHPYIGDASANTMTANFLNIYNYLGPFMNELETEHEPYGWKLLLAADIPKEKQAVREEDMERFSYLMIAVIENLDHVTWQYSVDGKALSKTVDAREATEYLGRDIKNCYEDVSLLDTLMQKTGLDQYAFGGTWSDSSYFPVTSRMMYSIPVVNNSDADVKGISIGIYADGELRETEGAENADGTAYERGSFLQFPLESGYLSEQMIWDLEIAFTVETMDGDIYEVPGRIRIPSTPAVTMLHDIHITGNPQEGFSVSR